MEGLTPTLLYVPFAGKHPATPLNAILSPLVY